MGHKRKKPGAKNRGPQNASDNTKHVVTSAAEASTAPSEADIDYVHYDSDADNTTTADKHNFEEDDEDGADEEDDDKDVEMGLADTQQNESDVEVTLDFYDPCPGDDTSIQNFLNPFLKRVPGIYQNNPSIKQKLSKTICDQTRVGTTVKVEDGEDPIGFISCLNVRRHKDMLKSLFTTLSKKDNSENKMFSKIITRCINADKGKFENEKMGLLVTERVVNIPPLVIPKLLEAIFCEIEWAVEDEPTKELREEYRFGWYLYISEAFIASDNGIDKADDKEDEGMVKGESKKKKKNVKKQKVDLSDLVDNDDSFQYVKVEDYAWFKYASHKLLWPLATEESQTETNKSTGGRIGIAMLVASKNIPNVRKMVEQVVGAIQEPDEDDESKNKMEP